MYVPARATTEYIPQENVRVGQAYSNRFLFFGAHIQVSCGFRIVIHHAHTPSTLRRPDPRSAKQNTHLTETEQQLNNIVCPR